MAKMSGSYSESNREKFFGLVKNAGVIGENRSVEKCRRRKGISGLRAKFSEGKGRRLHCANLAQFVFGIGRVFWFCSTNNLQSRNCFLQIHFVTNLLGSESVNGETDDKYAGIFPLVSR